MSSTLTDAISARRWRTLSDIERLLLAGLESGCIASQPYVVRRCVHDLAAALRIEDHEISEHLTDLDLRGVISIAFHDEGGSLHCYASPPRMRKWLHRQVRETAAFMGGFARGCRMDDVAASLDRLYSATPPDARCPVPDASPEGRAA